MRDVDIVPRWGHFSAMNTMSILLGATFALLLAVSVVNLFDYYTWMYAPGRLWQWLAWGLFSAALEKAG